MKDGKSHVNTVTRHWRRRMIAAAVVVAMGGVAAMGLSLTRGVAPQDENAANTAEVGRRRVQAAEKVYGMLLHEYELGREHGIEVFHDWSVLWLNAELDVPAASEVDSYGRHVARMSKFEGSYERLWEAGRLTQLDLEKALFYMIEAQYWLKRAEGE